MLLRSTLAAAALAVFAAATPAGATPIGPPPLTCTNNTCQGAIYELTYSGNPISSTATTQTFAITLTIDPTGYNGGGAFINAVAPKVSNTENSVTLASAPGVLANWTTLNGGVNAGGCSMAGAGFVCAEDEHPPSKVPLGDAPVPKATTYTWEFDITVPTGGLTPNLGTIKVEYTDGSGKKVGNLVSEPITLEVVPEPSTAVLLAAGLGCIAGLWRRGPNRRL
jgi:hypothetical protein